METIKLRPHHVRFISDIIFLELEMLKGWKEHVPRDVQIAANDVKIYLAKLLDVYHGTVVKESVDLAREFINNPQMPVRIVEGQDGICRCCCFNEACINGEYGMIIESYRRCGFPLKEGSSPIEDDLECLERFNLQFGQKYLARDLFFS
ncbi:hypothetical protein HYW76_05680 [Candidatus Pacearchaeota archaeon]|nr:hypothetical protein [Candidatus Pacearchaeota archaeon]